MFQKISSLFLIVFSLLSVNAQEIYEIDYVVDGQSAKAYSFTINRCNMDAINKTWLNWVKSKGGKYSIINNVTGKKEATSVKFKGDNESYKAYLEIVQTTDSIKILNAFKDSHGMFVHDQSSTHPIIYEALKDLSFEIRKSCVLLEIEQANSYMVKLNKEYVNLQKKKGNLEQVNFKNQNQVLKSETQKNKLREEISNLNNQIENTKNPELIGKLSKKLTTTETKYFKIESEIENKILAIGEDQLHSQQTSEAIEGIQIQIQDQQQLIDNLKETLNNIFR